MEKPRKIEPEQYAKEHWITDDDGKKMGYLLVPVTDLHAKSYNQAIDDRDKYDAYLATHFTQAKPKGLSEGEIIDIYWKVEGISAKDASQEYRNHVKKLAKAICQAKEG